MAYSWTTSLYGLFHRKNELIISIYSIRVRHAKSSTLLPVLKAVPVRSGKHVWRDFYLVYAGSLYILWIGYAFSFIAVAQMFSCRRWSIRKTPNLECKLPSLLI